MDALLADKAMLAPEETLRDLALTVSQLRDYAALAHFPIMSAIAAPFHALVTSMQCGRTELNRNALQCFADALRLVRREEYRDKPLAYAKELIGGLREIEASILTEDMCCLS